MEHIYEASITYTCLIGLVIYIFILYVLGTYATLRTVPNKLFANWIFLQALTEICMIIYYSIIINETEFASEGFFDAIAYFMKALFMGTVLSTLSLALDWLLAVSFQNASKAFRKSCIITISCIWILTIITSVMLICIDTEIITIRHGYFTLCLYFASIVFVAAIQIYRITQKSNSRVLEYSHLLLTLGSIYLILFIPVIMCNLLFGWFDIILPPAVFLSSNYLIRYNPAVILLLLLSFNQDFKKCVENTLRISKRRPASAAATFGNPEGSDGRYSTHI